ncbi:hypothetical protein [Rhodococcus sp. ACS1]|uniref:hypothetical protein n=1 Tax=Rhodococcus sp. ACS1 TaxID=2028570 RepID=UPI0015CDE87E|nr:hypothetical protein [Rhodococcus sp. ACS1]
MEPTNPRRARSEPVHRWAVAVDDGRLVFADTEDLTVDPGAGRTAPGYSQVG